jgi:hypothetical protein
MIALPLGGAVAALLGCLVVRRDRERLWAWATVALMTVFALGLMFWQVRAGPAAQFLAIPAVAWAGWGALEMLLAGHIAERLVASAGIVAVLLLFHPRCIYPE